MTASKDNQRLSALDRANEVRFAQVALKRELRAETITLAAALDDGRAETLTIGKLLLQLPRWGDARVRKTLHRLMISERKRVGALTGRQKRMVVRRVLGLPAETPPRAEPLNLASLGEVSEWLEAS